MEISNVADARPLDAGDLFNIIIVLREALSREAEDILAIERGAGDAGLARLGRQHMRSQLVTLRRCERLLAASSAGVLVGPEQLWGPSAVQLAAGIYGEGSHLVEELQHG